MYYDFSKREPKKTKEKHPLDKKGKLLVLAAISVLVISVLSGFGVAKLLQLPEPAPEPEEPSLTPEEIEHNLDLSFLKLESRNQNLIYSPLSIKNGLALLEAGATGETKAEIENVLGDVIVLDKDANIQNKLSLANAIFVRDTFKENILDSYTTTVSDVYNAEIIYDSFTSTTAIDSWVDQKTFGLIKTLGLKLNKSTEMVLANALAIQLDWLHQFDFQNTSGQDFTTAKGEQIVATTLSMTTQAEDIKYYSSDGLTALSLPLEQAGEAKLEFVAIMPSGDLSKYIKTLNLADLKSELALLSPASSTKDGVKLSIPKFKFDYELAFKKDLTRLGISNIFTRPLADFSNMADTPLYVSDAVHKANIDFSEKGIKAAAVTAFAMDVGSAFNPNIPQPVVIKFDRPFLFLIRDKDNGSIWFLGTVYQPNLWSDDIGDYEY